MKNPPNIDLSPARRFGAFTLVELLVVIAVIGILAGLLLSVLGQAKANALRTTCLNDLRQINMGLRMYADDSSDNTPQFSKTTNSALLSFVGYKSFAAGYMNLKGTNLFACPADTFCYTNSGSGLLADRTYTPQSAHDQSLFDYSSYAFNGGNTQSNLVTGEVFPGIAGWKLGSIRNPARTVLVAEVPAFYPFSWHQSLSLTTRPGINDARSEVSFVDGHVNYIKIFWNGGGEAFQYDPPAGYDYQWSGN